MEEEVKRDHTVDPSSIDEAVAEFNRARANRMSTRRARVTGKIAAMKTAQGITEVASNSSSTELLVDNTDKEGEDISTTDGERKSVDETSQSKKHTKRKEEEEIKKKTVGVSELLDQQIEESKKQLEQMILDGEMLITNVRVAAQYREKVRQAKAEESRKERLARLRQDAEESKTMYDALSANWKMKAEKTLPMEMFEQMKSQQAACDELLAKKDELITAFQREIAERDFDYDGSLEMYQKDSMLMGDRIDDLVTDLRMAFIEELNLIEDYTCKNREVILEDNQGDWLNLLQDFEAMEQKNLEDRKADALAKFQILNDFFIATRQEARRLRHKIEDDFRILFQEREQAKYACHLNLEKVIYNLHVLKCRSKENLEMKNRMKRLVIRLHDKFEFKAANLRKKMEMGRKYIDKASKEIQRLETQVETFGQKTLHIALSNHKTYMDLWEANEELVRDRVKRLLETDKFIYETQLGLEYVIPDLAAVFEARPKEVNNYFKKKLRGVVPEEKKAPDTTAVKKDSRKGSKDSKKNSAPSQHSSSDSDNSDDEYRDSLVEANAIKLKEAGAEDPAMQRRLIKAMAKMICDPNGLLLEDELQKILIPLFMTEKNLVNLDAVVMALGITDADEIRSLSRYLLKYCKVLQGVIPWSDSDASAGVNEMNVSLTGVIGKAAALFENESDPSDDDQEETDVSDPTAYHDYGDDNACFHEPEEYCDCKTVKMRAREEAEERRKLSHVEERKASKRMSKKNSRKSDGRKSTSVSKMDLEPKSHHDLCGDVVCCSPTSSTEFPDGLDSDSDLEKILYEVEGEDGSKLFQAEEEDLTDCSLNTSKGTVLSWLESVDREKMIQDLNAFNEDMGQTCDALIAEKVALAREVQLAKEIHLIFAKEEEMEEEEEEERAKKSQMEKMEKLQAYLGIGLMGLEEKGEQEDDEDGEAEREGVEDREKMEEEEKDRLEEEKYKEEEKAKEEEEEEEDDEEEEEEEEWGGEVEEEDDEEEEKEEEEEEEEELEAEEINSVYLICPREPRPRRLTKEEQREMQKAGILTIGGGIMEKAEVDSDLASDSANSFSVFSYESFTEDSEDDYLYVDPVEVVDALKRFIDDYNNRMKMFAPTVEGTIRKKLAMIKYPSFVQVTEYWERIMTMLNLKGKDIWETVQQCFDEYNKVLKERNEHVIEIQKFYQQNYELGHLLQKYFQSPRFSRRGQIGYTGPWDPYGMNYC